MVCSRPSAFDNARLAAALIGTTLVLILLSIYFRIKITSLIVTVARPIILFAVATVAAGAGVVAAVTTTTLALLLLVLLLLVFELLLKLLT